VTSEPFERVVAEHGATVLRVCRAVLGPDEAQDAWSETFLAALRGYPELPSGTNLQAWLVTIAHRKAIDITRARARSAVPMDEPPDQVSTMGVPGGADGQLWADVAALPDKQRLAVAYHYLAGLPHRQVAGILGGTEEAARRAAADGIKALRRGYASSGTASSNTAPSNTAPSNTAPSNTAPSNEGCSSTAPSSARPNARSSERTGVNR
jgi:RNA polymerase sigma factor (sigma-70 family)